MTSVAVLMTCHNRREKTVLCLEALFDSKLTETITIEVYLVDDGSTDGTAQAVQSKFPDVLIIKGDGSLFWNRGMHIAFSEASRKDYDFYLWLNDDTHVFENTLVTLIAAWEKSTKYHKHDNHIIIGSTCDTLCTSTTYGGLKKMKCLQPLKYEVITPTDKLQYADTMNGNIVLIPRSVFKIVGNLDKRYSHSMGDFDYGFRAIRNGCNLVVAPLYQGICSRNSTKESWKDQSLPLKLRLKKMFSKKGLPFSDWMLFCSRNTGILWPVWTISPYLKLFCSGIFLRKGSIQKTG